MSLVDNSIIFGYNWIVMKPNLFFVFVIMTLVQIGFAQVGFNTTTPQAALDIASTDAGVLLPRIELTSLTSESPVTNPHGVSSALVTGTLVWNTGTGGVSDPGFYYWQGGRWNKILNNNDRQVAFGTILIDAAGNRTVNGVGFEPRSVEFIAVNRVQGINDGAYRSDSNNSNDVRMAGGFTTGFAVNNGGSITQQAIATGMSGSSINNIGTYSSSSHCIAAFFVNNNGEPIHDNGSSNGGSDSQDGLIRASLTSFNTDGFSLNVDRFLEGNTSSNRTNQIVVVYKAYRY